MTLCVCCLYLDDEHHTMGDTSFNYITTQDLHDDSISPTKVRITRLTPFPQPGCVHLSVFLLAFPTSQL